MCVILLMRMLNNGLFGLFCTYVIMFFGTLTGIFFIYKHYYSDNQKLPSPYDELMEQNMPRFHSFCVFVSINMASFYKNKSYPSTVFICIVAFCLCALVYKLIFCSLFTLEPLTYMGLIIRWSLFDACISWIFFLFFLFQLFCR